MRCLDLPPCVVETRRTVAKQGKKRLTDRWRDDPFSLFGLAVGFVFLAAAAAFVFHGSAAEATGTPLMVVAVVFLALSGWLASAAIDAVPGVAALDRQDSAGGVLGADARNRTEDPIITSAAPRLCMGNHDEPKTLDTQVFSVVRFPGGSGK